MIYNTIDTVSVWEMVGESIVNKLPPVPKYIPCRPIQLDDDDNKIEIEIEIEPKSIPAVKTPRQPKVKPVVKTPRPPKVKPIKVPKINATSDLITYWAKYREDHRDEIAARWRKYYADGYRVKDIARHKARKTQGEAL